MSIVKRPVVWLWVLLTAVSFWFYPRYELRLSLEINKSAEQEQSLYHSYHLKAFTADHHRFLKGGVVLDGGYQRYDTVLRTHRPVRMLRLDPLVKPGQAKIRLLDISSAETLKWSMAELRAQLRSVHHLAPPTLSDSGAELILQSQGEDPFFSFHVDPQVYGDTAQQTGLMLLASALFWAAVLVAARRLERWYRSEPVLLLRIRSGLGRWGAPLSDPALVVFSPRVLLILMGLVITFVLGVTLKLNFSSLEIWNNHYKLDSSQSLVALGDAKVIRSDEWYVHSPWVFSQANRGLPVDNSNIGPPGAALLVAVPVKHVSMIAQPKYWGFLFLDADRAYAWFWLTKAVGLFLFGFLLFLVLTRNDVVLSLAGSVLLYSSSYLQWWFSAFTPEVLTGFMASLLGAFYVISGTRRGTVWAGAVLLPLSMANLILHLYPAHIVSMAYVALFLMVPMVWIAWKDKVVQPLLKTRVLAGGLAMVVFVSLAFSVISTAWPAIQAMMGTVYPGHRFSTGGGLGLEQVLMGFFEFWRNGSEYPSNGVNQSETARFIFLFPLGFLALGFYRYDWRLSAYIGASTLFAVCCLFWMSWYLPDSVRMVLAKLGWSYVPSNRLYLALGVVSVVVLVLTCQLMSKADVATRVRAVLAWTVVPLLLFAAWWYLRGFDPAFYHWQRLLASVVIVGGLAAAAILGRRRWLLCFALLAGWHSLQVNPVLLGSDVLLNKTVFTVGSELAGQGDATWAVYGDLKVAQGLRAQGQNVLNGAQYAPNHGVMRFFDPDGQQQKVWNRYANMAFLMPRQSDGLSFELRAPDLFVVNIHPCHPAFEQAGVRWFAFANVGDPGVLPCLRPIRAFPSIDVFYYERIR